MNKLLVVVFAVLISGVVFAGDDERSIKSPPAVKWLEITYKSVPLGAVVVERASGEVLGETPFTVKYPFVKGRLFDIVFHVLGLSVYWPDDETKKASFLFCDRPSEKKYSLDCVFVAIPPVDKKSSSGGYLVVLM